MFRCDLTVVVPSKFTFPVLRFTWQAEIDMKELCESCVLLSETGEVIDEKLDKRMQFHFEAMLDINKQLKKDQEKDGNLLGKLQLFLLVFISLNI